MSDVIINLSIDKLTHQLPGSSLPPSRSDNSASSACPDCSQPKQGPNQLGWGCTSPAQYTCCSGSAVYRGVSPMVAVAAGFSFFRAAFFCASFSTRVSRFSSSESSAYLSVCTPRRSPSVFGSVCYIKMTDSLLRRGPPPLPAPSRPPPTSVLSPFLAVAILLP